MGVTHILLGILVLAAVFNVQFYFYYTRPTQNNSHTQTNTRPNYRPNIETLTDAYPNTNTNTNTHRNQGPSSFKSAYDYKNLKLPKNFAKCLAEEEEEEEVTSPLLSVVVTSSLDHVSGNQGDFDAATANLRCYSQIHGTHYFSNLIDSRMVDESSNFFGKRWQTLYDRYIVHPQSKWVFQVDADTIIANLSKSIDKYLDTPAEVILPFRRKMEVSAAMAGFRAASPFARCFLKTWISYGAMGANWDNGDLLQLLMDIVDPDLGNKCQYLREDLYSFIDCFSTMTPKLRDIEQTLPLKIYFPFSGLWRSLECWVGETGDKHLFRHCVDDDFFVHGWKEIGRKHITPEIYKCDESNPALYGPLKKCHWKNADETLAYTKSCCYEAYKGCQQDGKNVCTENNPQCELREGVPKGYLDCRYQHIDCPDIPY